MSNYESYLNQKFEIGDRVTCIDNNGISSYLKLYEEYIITKVYYSDYSNIIIHIQLEGSRLKFAVSRFTKSKIKEGNT